MEYTPSVAAACNGNVELVKLLLDRGAMITDVSEKNVYIDIRANLLSNNWSKIVTIDFIDNIDYESLSNYRTTVCINMLESCYYNWYDRVVANHIISNLI